MNTIRATVSQSKLIYMSLNVAVATYNASVKCKGLDKTIRNRLFSIRHRVEKLKKKFNKENTTFLLVNKEIKTLLICINELANYPNTGQKKTIRELQRTLIEAINIPEAEINSKHYLTLVHEGVLDYFSHLIYSKYE